MFQVLIDIAPEGTSQPHSANAKVIVVDATKTDEARKSIDKVVDELLGQLATGWTPSTLDPAAAAKAADALVEAKQAELDAAKEAADQAHKDADAAAEEAAEPDNAPKPAPAAAPPKPAPSPLTGTASGAKGYAGPDRRTAKTKRRQTDTGNPNGLDRRTGPADRRSPAQQ